MENTSRKYVLNNSLVFDLGMNNGDDTLYYLKKGLRVVAIEANPAMVQSARIRFCRHILSGQLEVVHAALWEEYAQKPFYVNNQSPHLSSLDPAWAARDNADITEIHVQCLPLVHLFAVHGVPMYLKIDIEGGDEMVLDQMAPLSYLPGYLSIEDCRFGYRYLDKLSAMGYTGFKLVNQALIPEQIDEETGFRFQLNSSGPLGDLAPGPWLGRGEMLELYAQQVRGADLVRIAPPEVWWDIHAKAPIEHAV